MNPTNFIAEFRGYLNGTGLSDEGVERMGMEESRKRRVVFEKSYADNFTLRNNTSSEDKRKGIDPIKKGLMDCESNVEILKKNFGDLVTPSTCVNSGVGGNEVMHYGFTTHVKLKKARMIFQITNSRFSNADEVKAVASCAEWVAGVRKRFGESTIESRCNSTYVSDTIHGAESEIRFIGP